MLVRAQTQLVQLTKLYRNEDRCEPRTPIGAPPANFLLLVFSLTGRTRASFSVFVEAVARTPVTPAAAPFPNQGIRESIVPAWTLLLSCFPSCGGCVRCRYRRVVRAAGVSAINHGCGDFSISSFQVTVCPFDVYACISCMRR